MSLASELATLSTLLEESPEYFTSGSRDIQAAALNAAQYIFNLSVKSEPSSKSPIVELISSLTIADAPRTRSQTHTTSTRDSLTSASQPVFRETPIQSLFVEELDDDQLWAQLELRTNNICNMLDLALEGENKMEDEDEDEDITEEESRLLQEINELQNGQSSSSEDSEDEESTDESDSSQDEMDANSQHVSDEDLEKEGITYLNDGLLADDIEEQPSSLLDVNRRSTKPRTRILKGKKTELDDGFFNLASFNAEVEQAEALRSSKGRLSGDDDSEDDDIPFDLFGPVDNNHSAEGPEDAGEAYYNDFFELPKKSSQASVTRKTGKVRFNEEVRVKNIKAKGKNRPLSSIDTNEEDEEDEEDEDYEVDSMDDDELRDDGIISILNGNLNSAEEDSGNDSEADLLDRNAMDRFKDDLFAEDEEDAVGDMTTHERRLAALTEQIAQLESENVAPKEWMLMGEAGSKVRPQNSLLEEDLEFERVMKVVPIITEESVQTLEDTIKARIVEGQFDDVVRIRPLEDKPFLPSRFFELQDKKSTQSLAQIYENEFVATQSNNSTDDRDGKLKKEHDEIEHLWEKICGKLDALCNAHFVPKQPKAIISSISNVATATLESALPTLKSASSMLAPEEVFAPSSSEIRARSELTPAEKRSQRTKEQKARKKQRDVLEKSTDKYSKMKSVKKQKQAALESVVKNGKGVTVVGKPTKTKSMKAVKHKA
ncbi:U3 small nucleolar ribonucleoprotein complex, subunit Mpp10 [Cyathus striatus]|nr:U3 small nucleolar ribonucleoprotein complex, subunit Mpp10 [Cyathus striatus]